MAIETRAFQFFRSETEGEIDPQTLTLPIDRMYHGVVGSPIGPVLFVQGEWSAAESVDISFVRYESLAISNPIAGLYSDDNGNGFVGVCIES